MASFTENAHLIVNDSSSGTIAKINAELRKNPFYGQVAQVDAHRPRGE
jgi:hypothetical protein